MKIELIDSPDENLNDFLFKKIEEFNMVRWEVKEKKGIAVQVKDETGSIVAGAAGKTFGLWLLLENLWVSEELRGQNFGSKVLELIESGARRRGCSYVLLDTLNFQARPFYERHGYRVEWTQSSYPRDGCKYFMVKDLV